MDRRWKWAYDCGCREDVTGADESVLQGVCRFCARESDIAFLLRQFCELKNIEVVGKGDFV